MREMQINLVHRDLNTRCLRHGLLALSKHLAEQLCDEVVLTGFGPADPTEVSLPTSFQVAFLACAKIELSMSVHNS